MVLCPENLHGGFYLGQGGNKIGFCGLPVGIKAPGAQRLPLANPGIDDDPVELTKLLPESLKNLGHLCVIIHIQGPHTNLHSRIGALQLGPELVQPLGTTGTQGKVITPGSKLPGHAFTQSGTGSGNQYSTTHEYSCRLVIIGCRGAGTSAKPGARVKSTAFAPALQAPQDCFPSAPYQRPPGSAAHRPWWECHRPDPPPVRWTCAELPRPGVAGGRLPVFPVLRATAVRGPRASNLRGAGALQATPRRQTSRA